MSGFQESGFGVYADEDMLGEEVDFGNDEAPIDDDDSTVFSEMEESDIGDEDDLDDENTLDMSHAVFKGHSDCVYTSKIHPSGDGTVISGGGDDKGYLWKFNPDSSSEEEEKIVSSVELGGHTDTVTSVGFNFDGTIALTASYDGTVRTWNAATGELLIVMDGPEDCEWAQWHSKGNAIIAGSKDGTIWMWLAHDGQCVQVFAGHDGGVSAGCFSIDGKFVCSGGEDGSVRLWAPKTGACKHVFDGQQGHSALVTVLETCTYDADLLLSGSVDGLVHLYQISGKRLLQTFVHCTPIAGANLGTIEEGAGADGGESDEDPDIIDEEVLSVECVGFATGVRWVASGGMDKNLKVWDMDIGTIRCTCAHVSGVVALRWHSSAPIVMTSTLGKTVSVWDARAGIMLAELTGHRQQITSFDSSVFFDTSNSRNDASMSSTEIGEHEQASREMECIVTVSDDRTARVFMIDAKSLL